MMTKMMMMHKNRYILIVTSIVLAYEEATFVSINYSTTGRSFISIYLYTRNTVACRSPLGCKEREWCDKIILITFQNFTHSSYVVDLKANKLGLLLSPEILSHYVNSMYKWDSCCRAEGRECEPFNPKYRVAITNNALLAHPHIYKLIITNYQLIFNHSDF